MPSIHGWYGLKWLFRSTLLVWYREVRTPYKEFLFQQKIVESSGLFFCWTVHVFLFFGGKGGLKEEQLWVGESWQSMKLELSPGETPPKTQGQCCWWMLIFPMWIKCGDVISSWDSAICIICVYLVLSKLDQCPNFFCSVEFLESSHLSLSHPRQPISVQSTTVTWCQGTGKSSLRDGCSFVPKRVRSKFKGSILSQVQYTAYTLPKTNSSPLKQNFPKRKVSSSNHPFSGAFAVSFREGYHKHLGHPWKWTAGT